MREMTEKKEIEEKKRNVRGAPRSRKKNGEGKRKDLSENEEWSEIAE